ncbi:DUF4340 domain-containing protein [Herbinix luporum]|uniref:DUF4340 domain-containing protein n=1 Tax=Herbinix luporum TaxID=1679721 RepID=UPI0023F2B00D|nr:DUF4340 domain-containing protein [Herbinix luporum]
MTKRKKKNLLTLIFLVVMLGLMSGFYVWYLNKNKDRGETASEDDSLILATMDPDLIERIHFKNDEADMILILEDDTWVTEADKERPIKQNYVDNMISIIDEVKAERIVDEKPEDLAQYGLVSPYASLKATQSDGKSVTLLLGDEVSGGQGYYAKLDGNDTVFIVPTLYGTYLSYSDVSMTQVDNGPSLTSNDIYHIEVLKKDGEDFELIYDEDSKYHKAGTPLLSWAVLKPFEEPYSADSSKVSEVISNFTRFYFLSCVDYKGEDLAKYGLEDPTASILVEYYEQHEEELDEPQKDPDTGEEITTKTVTEEKSFKLYIGNLNDKGDYYVRKDGEAAVYTMEAEDVDAMLQVDAFSILSTFISIYNIETVDRIDIDISGKPYTMEIKREVTTDSEGNEETKASYYYNGKEVEEDTFKDVYQVMIGAKFDTQLKEEVSLKELDPILTISYHLEDSDKTYTSKYYPYDESFYIADNGGPIIFKADKRRIDQIIKTIEEFKKAE